MCKLQSLACRLTFLCFLPVGHGINIKEYNLLKYREKFASVFQDYRIFAMTVAENGLTEEVTEENRKVAVNALEMAGVLPKINKLPNKEDSILTKEFQKDGVHDSPCASCPTKREPYSTSESYSSPRNPPSTSPLQVSSSNFSF